MQTGFRQGLLLADVDLCKAFESVNQDALSRIVGLRGVPRKLINLISELYSGTENAVRCGGSISNVFPVATGLCQGCVLDPHFSVLVRIGFWGGCLRDIAVVHRLGMSGSLTLIS